MRKTLSYPAVILFGLCWTSAAHAQTDSGVLVTPAVPEGFDRGRNVSVTERPRPDYDELGIREGGFQIFPRVKIGIGATSNPYLLSSGGDAAAVVSVIPSIQINSDWARDYASLFASGTLNRYVSNGRRNESWFDLRSVGRKDIGTAYSVTGEAQYGRLYESPTSGAVDPSLAVLSSYYRGYVAVRGQYTVGKGRATVALDRTSFSFNDLKLADGTRVSQADRDRIVSRITGEMQYAFTPSMSVYGQATYGKIDYSERLDDGSPNRNSTGWRVIGGVNFDLAGMMRGRVGVGYIRRNYSAAQFGDVGGFSAEGQVEFFPTDLTTLTLSGGRTLEDAGVFGNSAYFDNRVTGQIDHELLRNLILGGEAEYRRQTYVDSSITNNYFRTAANAKYLSSRFLILDADISYLSRTGGSSSTSRFGELRGMIGITIQR